MGISTKGQSESDFVSPPSYTQLSPNVVDCLKPKTTNQA